MSDLKSMFFSDFAKKTKTSSFNVQQGCYEKNPDYSSMKTYKSDVKPPMCMIGGNVKKGDWDNFGIPITKEEIIRKKLFDNPRLSANDISIVREEIESLNDEQLKKELFRLLQSKTPYHSQRDNDTSISVKVKNKKTGKYSTIENYQGDVMCNLTSVAMALETLGVVNPSQTMQFEDYLESLRIENEYANREDPSSWVKVAKLLSVNAKLYSVKKWKLTKEYANENLLTELQLGNAVVISVFKPPKGHIVRLQDVTDEGLIVDDPFGKVDAIAREKGGFGYKGNSNPKRGDAGVLVGEDNLWKWETIEKISIKYYVVFSK